MKTHKDILGNIIDENSMVAIAHKNRLMICSIMKITDKKIRVRPLEKTNYDIFYKRDEIGYLKSPHQAVVVEGTDVTAYMLRRKP